MLTLFFWKYPSFSVKQAHTVRARANLPVTEEEWTKKFDQITAEHKVNETREELSTGWKQWLAARSQAAVGAGSADGAAAGPAQALDLPFLEP